MVSRLLTAALLVAGLSLSSGCRMYPCGNGVYDGCIGGSRACGLACGGGCDSCGVDSCGCDGGCGVEVGCGCGGGPVGNCGCEGCGCEVDICNAGCGIGLLDKFHRWAGCKSCGGGCGETYYGPWLSDPPDCCDPCDCWGGYAGRGCCGRKSGLFQNFWGHRYNDCGDCCGVSSTCAGCANRGGYHGGQDVYYGGETYTEGEVYYEGAPSNGRSGAGPTPADQGPPMPPGDGAEAMRPRPLPTYSVRRSTR